MKNIETPIKLFIVDDHPSYVEGLSLLLSQHDELQVIGSATNGLQSLQLIEHLNPDVVLMDFKMEGLDGMQTTVKLLEENPDLKVLMLTMHDDFTLVKEALGKGVMGFELKNVASDKLIEGIKSVFSGKRYLGEGIHETIISQITSNIVHPAGGNNFTNSTNPNIEHPFTPREFEIAQLLATGKPRKEIANDLHISLNTVDTHCKSIFAKIGVKNVAELINWLRNRGLFN